MDENSINDMNDELENVIEEGRNILEELNLEERLDELRTEAELMIRKNPLASVAISAAVGFILGKILR